MPIENVSIDRIIRKKELKKLTGFSDTSIDNRLNPNSKYFDPMFPKKIRIGLRAVGFMASQVEAYLSGLSNRNEAGRYE